MLSSTLFCALLILVLLPKLNNEDSRAKLPLRAKLDSWQGELLTP